MTKSNEHSWTKWLVGAVWFCLTTAIIITGNNVIANDKTATKVHEEIREELKRAEDEALDRCEELRLEVKEDLKNLQEKMDVMQKDQHRSELVQAKILAIVQNLEKR